MAKIVTTHSLALSEREAGILKKLLGSFSDPEFSKIGISGADRELMRDIYNQLPYEDEE